MILGLILPDFATKRRVATIVRTMEVAIRIQIEELSEGLYLATSDELPGLVAQGRTVAEALDIARDVAGSQDSAGTMKNSNGSGLTCV